MFNLKSVERSGSQEHPVEQDSGAAERGASGSSPSALQASPLQASPSQASSSQASPSIPLPSSSPAAGGQGRSFANVLRAGLARPAIAEKLPTISQDEVNAAWNKIVADDIEMGRRTNTKSMSQNQKLESSEAQYRTSVNAWLDNPTTEAQLVQQKQEIRDRPIDKSKMLPGDLLLRKEAPPQSLAHALTLPFHLKQNLNGIAQNNGDHNVFHVAQWIGNKNDRTVDTKIEIAEARGGLGTTNALRVLAQSIQAGQYWVYRAKPDYGLPPAARDEIIGRRREEAARFGTNAVPPMIGEASSVIAEMFADKKEPYSKSMLSSSMRADGEFVEPTPYSREDAFKLAAAPTSMSHVGETSENVHYHEVKTRENAERHEKRSVKREGGDTCSTFVARTAQTAALQIAAAYYMEQFDKKIKETHPALDNDAVRALLREAVHFSDDGQMNDNVRETFDQAFDGFTGLIAKNPEGLAPKTIEHFCREDDNFEFVGVLTIGAADVLEKEMCFDEKGNPISVETSPPSAAATSSQTGAVAQTDLAQRS